jgi:hypothetical protein
MEQIPEQSRVSLDNSKLSPVEEPLNKSLEKTPAYELPAEAFLRPQNIDHHTEPDTENTLEGFSVGTQYQNMIGDIVMDKVLRPNMTDAEINTVATAIIVEYEAPITEEAVQEETRFMDQASAENKKEVIASNEQTLSPLSRAIELMGDWLSEHPAWAKSAMGAVVVSELAGCATGGGYYRGTSTAQEMVSTGLYGAGEVVQNEIYGRQNARMNASNDAENARAYYEESMMEENAYYRQSLNELAIYGQGQGYQAETQETNTNGAVSQKYAQDRALIESRHQQAVANIQGRFQREMQNTQNRYARQMQNTDMRTQNIQLNTGARLLNQAIRGLMYGR